MLQSDLDVWRISLLFQLEMESRSACCDSIVRCSSLPVELLSISWFRYSENSVAVLVVPEMVDGPVVTTTSSL